MRLGFSRLAISLAVCLPLIGGVAAIAQDTTTTAAAPTPEQVLAGKRVWADAACYNCHGNNGQGGNSKDFPHGPSLRTSQLDAETTLEVIACGLPGTLMPGWAKGAYTERPCFGETGPIPEETRVLAIYDEQQLDDLMAYIETTFRKKSQ
jgi:hypothetical protein